MLFPNVTIEQLRAAEQPQILTTLFNRLSALTKKQLIVFLVRVLDIDVETYELTELTESKDGPNGQVTRLYVTTDAMGTRLRSLRIDWTYYLNGPVDAIDLVTLDPDEKEISRRTIRHRPGPGNPLSLTAVTEITAP